MSDSIVISIDAMGGDAAPAAIVAGLQLSDDDAPPVDLHVLPQPGGALLSVGARL